jgi:hypothetical protein
LESTKFHHIIDVKSEKTLSISFWKNPPKFNSTDELDVGGMIKIFIREDKSLAIVHNPPIEFEKPCLSQISLNDLIMNCIQRIIIERLKQLMNFLQDKIPHQTHLHQDIENGNSYIYMNSFEDVLLLISIDWRNGCWILNSKYKNDPFTRIFSQKSMDNVQKIPIIISSFNQHIVLKEYCQAASLLELDSFISKSDQDQDCVFVRYPNYQNIFLMITHNNELTEIRLIYQQYIQEKTFSLDIPTVHFEVEKIEHCSYPCSHLTSFLKSHSKSIHQNFLIHQLSDRGILFQRQDSYFEFRLDCAYFTGDTFKLFFGEDSWRIETKENSFCFKKIGEMIGNVSYSENGNLVFKYTNEDLSYFISDLNSIDQITKIAIDIEKNFSVDEKKTISILSHNRIVLVYDAKKNYKVDIQWNIDHYSVSLFPSHELHSFIENYFNSNLNIVLLFKILKIVSYSILELKERNWRIIPRSVNVAKVIFQR